MWVKKIQSLYRILRPISNFCKQKKAEHVVSPPQHPVDPVDKLYVDYLDSKDTNLSIMIDKNDPKVRVALPKLFNTESNQKLLEQKFSKQWKQKLIVLDVDYSFTIGKKRQYIKNYYNQSLYRQHGTSPDLFEKMNPQYFLRVDQIKFEPDFFINTDADVIDLLDQQQYEDSQIDNAMDLYEKDPQRFSNRLLKEFNIPKVYHKVIERAWIQNCPVYLCGLNSYVQRNFLVSCFSLSELKGLFYQSLNFTLYQGGSLNQLNIHSIEIIYARNYKIIQKFQNGCILDALQQIPGNYIFFTKTPTALSISESFSRVQKVNKSLKDSADAQKIEKHALLSVLLGNIWEYSFTRNKFPYLSEHYFDLSDQDKSALQEIYHKNYVKYKGAAKLFFDKQNSSTK